MHVIPVSYIYVPPRHLSSAISPDSMLCHETPSSHSRGMCPIRAKTP